MPPDAHMCQYRAPRSATVPDADGPASPSHRVTIMPTTRHAAVAKPLCRITCRDRNGASCQGLEPQFDATPTVVAQRRDFRVARRAQAVRAVTPIVSTAPTVPPRVRVWLQDQTVGRVDHETTQTAGRGAADPPHRSRIDCPHSEGKGRRIAEATGLRHRHCGHLLNCSSQALAARPATDND
jgi:hypothetical protein